jgi:hypothetical protein
MTRHALGSQKISVFFFFFFFFFFFIQLLGSLTYLPFYEHNSSLLASPRSNSYSQYHPWSLSCSGKTRCPCNIDMAISHPASLGLIQHACTRRVARRFPHQNVFVPCPHALLFDSRSDSANFYWAHIHCRLNMYVRPFRTEQEGKWIRRYAI